MTPSINYLLFVQHGWNDDAHNIQQLAALLTTSDVRTFTPDLGILKTWFAIEPLIARVEQQLDIAMQWHPEAQLRIVGHSLGGLIWLELLDRRRELWPKVHSLILLGSPVGGANIARILDPFGILPTIARDLGKNRRSIAEEVARAVPLLVIAGDSDGGSDRVITVGSTRVENAVTMHLPGAWHNDLRTPETVARYIQQFWGNTTANTTVIRLIQQLQSIPGMTDAHDRDFRRARIRLTFRDGTTLRVWKNPLGIDHVFVADPSGALCFGGFVGWVHAATLQAHLTRIEQEFQAISSVDKISSK